MKSKISWIGVFIAAMLLWAAFGSIPYLLHLYGVISGDEIIRVAPYGGMFGAADAFFSGFALIAVIISIQLQNQALRMQEKALSIQNEELIESRNEMARATQAHIEMAEQQRKAVCLEIILPFMNEIMSAEMRETIINLTMFRRNEGYDNFAFVYGQLLNKRNSGTLSKEEYQQFEMIDTSRRMFIGVFAKLQRLHQTGVVDEEMVKVVLSPDHCNLLLTLSEPLEAQIRSNYSRAIFDFCRILYSQDVLDDIGTYKK